MVAARVALSLHLNRPLAALPLLRQRRTLLVLHTRKFSTSSTMDPKISEGENEAQVKDDLGALLENGWILDKDQIQLEKTYNFKTYTKVLDMHQVIGIKCKAKNHHPTMITTFGSLTVQWTTHSPRGLSGKDISMAKYCDQEANGIGIVKQGDGQRCGPAAAL